MKVKVISLPYIFQVLYVLCFTRPRYQVSVYRTIGPLVFHFISLASISATVFKVCIHNEDNQVYYCKQNQAAEIYFCLLFLFFFYLNPILFVMNMEIFVKDFSGTALPRILKFGTNIIYDKLYCV